MIDILEKSEKRNSRWWLGFLALALFLWASIIFFGDSKYADEGDHIRQIHRFMKGNYEVLSQITTLPGYHAVIAAVASVFGNPDSRQIRLISLVFSLLSIGVFYAVAKGLRVENPHIRTAQYILLPVSFLYFPLLYTDIFSLLLVLTALYFALCKKYSLSAFVSLLSLCVRQTNIVWTAFFWVYTYVSEYGFSFSSKNIARHIRNGAGYVGVILLFFAFVWMNGGVSIGDRERQQVGFFMGNLYFFLVIVGVLFLPVVVSSLSTMDRSFLKKRMMCGVLFGVAIASMFLLFPPGIHEYNLKMKFLRNIILTLGYYQYAWAYAAGIFFGCLAFALIVFEKRDFLIIPFSMVYFMPSFLVEQRYMIIPLVLMLLFRKETDLKREYAIAVYFLLLSSGLTYMLLKVGIFF